MRKSAILMVGLGLAGALVTSPMVRADEGARYGAGKVHTMSRHGEHGHGSMTTHLLKHFLKNKQELGLTDEQVTKLRTVALDADRAHIRAEADVMVSERELRSLMWDEKAQMPAIEAKVKEKAGLDATARIIGIKARRELMGILTPEQQAKHKALWHEYRHQDRRPMMKTEAGETTVQAGGVESAMDVSGMETGDLDGAPSAG